MDAIEIRSEGKLLFKLTPDSKIELVRDGWLHEIDVAETLRTRQPVVNRSYVGKKNVLTKIDMCARLSHN